jgi:tripartite ATP-independent transporter DctM subunit
MIEISPAMLTILMFSGLLVGIFLGHPLAFVLGGLAVIFGHLAFGADVYNIFLSRIYGVMDNYILIACPLFIFMAQLLDRSKVAEELFDVMRYLLGSVKGGIAVAVIVVSTLLAACTGIIGASIVTMGFLALPMMLRYGYDKRLASGVICAGGTLGILIPPSVMLIFMASETGLSVGRLFAGSIIPGLILGALYIVYVLFKCHFNPGMGPALTAEEIRAVPKKRLLVMVMKSMVPPMVLVVGVLGSIFAGIATPTEASGVGCALAFLLVVIYRKFSWQTLYDAFIITAKTSSMVLFIAVGATCFTGVFIFGGGTKVVEDLVLGIGLGKWGTFIFMMVITFILGMFVDWIGIIFITFPIFLPIAESFGFDQLWFVVAMAVMLQDSFLTPPFGYALFYLKGIAPPEVTTWDIYRGTFPFWRLMEVGLVICVIFPQTITWLPSILVR